MKLTVFGATGGTGLQVIEQGLAAGHEIRAVVRDATRLPDRPGLEVVVADVMDPAAIEEAVTGRDAIISAIGSRAGRNGCFAGAEHEQADGQVEPKHFVDLEPPVLSSSGAELDE